MDNKEKISKLIEICAKNGVSRLKMGELEIDFSPKAEPLPNINLVDREGMKFHPAFFEENDTTFQEIEDELAKEQDFSTLMIEDPEKYEELLSNGKLDSYGEPDA